jgi:hypothetical protein
MTGVSVARIAPATESRRGRGGWSGDQVELVASPGADGVAVLRRSSPEWPAVSRVPQELEAVGVFDDREVRAGRPGPAAADLDVDAAAERPRG